MGKLSRESHAAGISNFPHSGKTRFIAAGESKRVAKTILTKTPSNARSSSDGIAQLTNSAKPIAPANNHTAIRFTDTPSS
uniref:Uncharacterized protein n=1 Tax=Ralstonia solanacearum CFBP2957 TaxID=859656 RepID=D8P635_RALSL|nr:protein of unknown function [Ralstonia solanacearum CFBP2957]